jgi:hypothetical protein
MLSLELVILDGDRVVRRIAVNEDLREEYLRRRANGNGDMVTLWFFRFVASIFEPLVAGQNGTPFPFVDVTGTSRSIRVKVATGTAVPGDDVIWNTSGAANNRFWISVGTSSVTPSPSDFKLGNKVAEVLATRYVDESVMTVTLSGGITFTSDITIYEVGLEWECNVAGATTPGRILVDRTVFPDGIPVRANQTLSVVYRITL